MGKLFLVPTPIGNMEDITFRALNVLKSSDLILAEDTRVSKKLLLHYGIDKPIMPYHQHNEHQMLNNFVQLIQNRESVALVTDAGTPGISDPGFLLVRACLENNIEVECLPGATAFVPALVLSGLPCDRFYFYGFLPHKKGRLSTLERLSKMNETIVFYESPFRLIKTLMQLQESFGERKVCVCRELTKLFEEHFRGTLQEAIEHFEQKEVKGEIVIVVQGKDSNTKNKEE